MPAIYRLQYCCVFIIAKGVMPARGIAGRPFKQRFAYISQHHHVG
jgi:hypothetical protein